tara:strand:+ start:428 stop:1162 length:735 start_codon:yes stop_codon:yes gene_type:complete
MNIIILCAGMGKRFHSRKPKCLTKVFNKPIIDYTLNSISKIKSNKKKIIFATGYKENLIKKSTNKIYSYIRNPKYRSTNMVYTLINVLKKIKIDNTIIIYGDIIFSYKDLNKIALSNKGLVTLVDFKWKKLWRNNKKIDYDLETLKISKDKIVDLGKKTNEIKNIDARYVGITKFSKKIVKKIINLKKINIKKIDMTNFLMELIKQKITINYLKLNHDWYEFDNKRDLNIFKKKYKHFKNEKFN